MISWQSRWAPDPDLSRNAGKPVERCRYFELDSFNALPKPQAVNWPGLLCEACFREWKLRPAKPHYL